MVHRANVLLACSLIALGSAASACSDPEALGTSGSNLAMTLENGERYLDRIDGDRVVLFRTVNGRDLPFKDNEFPGKNIVIHPTTAKGDESLGWGSAQDLMQELGDLDRLEQLMRGASNPGALAEVDVERARELLGDEAALSLERMGEVAKMLEDAGLIENREGRLELTPRGIRKIGQNSLTDLFSKIMRDTAGRHAEDGCGVLDRGGRELLARRPRSRTTSVTWPPSSVRRTRCAPTPRA